MLTEITHTHETLFSIFPTGLYLTQKGYGFPSVVLLVLVLRGTYFNTPPRPSCSEGSEQRGRMVVERIHGWMQNTSHTRHAAFDAQLKNFKY